MSDCSPANRERELGLFKFAQQSRVHSIQLFARLLCYHSLVSTSWLNCYVAESVKLFGEALRDQDTTRGSKETKMRLLSGIRIPRGPQSLRG